MPANPSRRVGQDIISPFHGDSCSAIPGQPHKNTFAVWPPPMVCEVELEGLGAHRNRVVDRAMVRA